MDFLISNTVRLFSNLQFYMMYYCLFVCIEPLKSNVYPYGKLAVILLQDSSLVENFGDHSFVPLKFHDHLGFKSSPYNAHIFLHLDVSADGEGLNVMILNS